jgi:hypothetical protein
MKNKLEQEPVMAVAVVLALVLGVVGVQTDAATLYNVLVAVLPLVGGLVARGRVAPHI